ncbi:MFS transporter [Antribacter gilvus]|uniref:MFS transporter n=1 Tax=Antribacter gilvus TaxID=2304675 RepID=UPI000F798044|nr:MFS transporter [Antribacter gilvus]
MSGTTPVLAEESPSGPVPITGTLRRLLWWLLPANASVFLLWGAIPGTLLAWQVQDLDAANKEHNLAIVATVGAIAALLAQPIAGTVSDRTRSRLGRRAPWMIAGAVVGGLALGAMALAPTVIVLAAAWTVAQIAFNFVQGPLSAVLPDRVPRSVRGSFSGVIGAGTMLGMTLGAVVGNAMQRSVPVAYLLLAAVVIAVMVVFVVANPDRPSTGDRSEPFRLGTFLRTFWVSPTRHPDFFFAFSGRFLLNIGYNAVTQYQVYLLQDYIGLSRDAAAGLAIVLSGIAAAVITVTTLLLGRLSDRVGRRKIFVFGSSVTIAIALAIPWLSPTVPAMFGYAVVMGIGFGAFQAVDTALISEVLPSAQDYGKDLGVVNIAATLPQAVAPALAGAIVVGLGYAALFPFAIGVILLASVAVFGIKSVR